MFWITSVVVTRRPFRPENKALLPRVMSKNAAASANRCSWSSPEIETTRPAWHGHMRTVPVRHVELPFGDTRQYSLQLFEPLHVHGDLPGALFLAEAKAYAVRRKPQPAGACRPLFASFHRREHLNCSPSWQPHRMPEKRTTLASLATKPRMPTPSAHVSALFNRLRAKS